MILSISGWIAVITASFVIGLAKAGIKGIDMLTVTLMAFVFGSKQSTGVVLPLLCLGDIAAVWYYRRHVQWHHFHKLLPWMIAGILLGVYIGREMNEVLFRKIMAFIILLTIAIVLLMEYRRFNNLPSHPLFAAGTGLAAGFSTMIGNLAGAFSNLYFLAMRIEKSDFIGTTAWIFLFINLFKLPFQVFYWQNITHTTLSIDAVAVPALLLGFYCGTKIVGKIQDQHYRKLVIVLTLAGSVIMLLRS